MILLVTLVAGSLVYCVLTLLAARNYLSTRPPALTSTPPVTIMKPLFGADEGLAENLRGFFTQDYPDYEILMAVHSEEAPEAAIARQMMREFPEVHATIVATGPSPRPNGKVFALEHLMPEARHSMLVMSDSDIRVTPDMLRVLAAEMQDPGVDLVTCPYRAIAGASFWSRLEAVGMNAEFLGGVLAARYLNGMDFALGCTLAIRREALERIGGWPILRDYLAEDFMMGKLVAESGKRVVLSSYVIEHRIGSQRFRANLEHRLRWARSTRRSRPWGYAGEIFTRTLAVALLLVCAFPVWWPLSAVAILFRLIVAWMLAGPVLKCRNSLQFWLLLPIQDVVSFLCWAGGFFGNTILWRGRRLTVQPDGKF
ncbi:MAG: bacteriohopanetetrol glucosamine biosynthesis glycosyltransferase HpnI [Acidobacteriota bacterium]|nr:bacteriohopanetetrol glucosamine biosynthesis glycosyltransferase HpnI [Acidobacteriota bacterium]